MRKSGTILFILSLTVLLFALSGAVAQAEDEIIILEGPSVGLLPDSGPAGSQAVLKMTDLNIGNQGFEHVTLMWYSANHPDESQYLGEGVTDENGVFEYEFTVPDVAPGDYTVQADATYTCGDAFVPGELLVKFVDDASDQEIQDLLASNGLWIIEDISSLGVKKIGVAHGSEIEASERLSADPLVVYAEPNGLSCTADVPNNSGSAVFHVTESAADPGLNRSNKPDPAATEPSAGTNSNNSSSGNLRSVLPSTGIVFIPLAGLILLTSMVGFLMKRASRRVS